MEIVVCGSLNMDITLEVEELAKKGETILANGLKKSLGGKGQNQAVAIKRLGKDVCMLGAVGNDDYGKEIELFLENEGLEKNILIKDASTGVAYINIDKNGDNNIIVYSGANFMLTEEDFEIFKKTIKKAKICVLQLEIPLNIVYKCLEYCSANGIITILNPAPYNKNFDVNYLKYVDYLIPNETELEFLINKKNIDIESKLKEVKNLGVKNVLVTLGENGSLCLLENGEYISVPARKVKAIDTTAAGDSFISGFVSKLIEDKSVKEAMEFATKVSSIVVTKKGAIDSLPLLEEVNKINN